MKNLVSMLCLLLFACAHAQLSTVAIRGVTVVDVMDGSLHPEHTVLVTGDRITANGPADLVRTPDDADLVDAAGGFLIPGLWDMHVHSVANVTWDMDVRAIGNAEWHFPLFLAHGITGVRNMNDAAADPTLELTRSVKRRLAEGDLFGPRLLAKGPTIDGDPPLTSNPVVVRTAAEGRGVVDTLADHGADFVKVYTNLSREAYFAIMDQACQRGIPVDGHPPFRALPAEAADAGQRTTVNPARVLGMADSLGTIEAGKLADLVLLDMNPLADIANTRRIRAVVADGRLYRRADLDRLLAGVETLNHHMENQEQ